MLCQNRIDTEESPLYPSLENVDLLVRYDVTRISYDAVVMCTYIGKVIEPVHLFERYVLVVVAPRDGLLWEHVEHVSHHGRIGIPVQVTQECAQAHHIRERVVKELVHIHQQAPAVPPE